MKKLITLLTTLLIIGNMSGQVLPIHEQPYALDWGLKFLIKKDLIHNVKVDDNSFYVLSYTPEKFNRPSYGEYRIERNLYLCLVEFIGKTIYGGDSVNYEIVSPILQTDYIQNRNDTVSYTTYVSLKDSNVYFDGFSGYMKKLENGDIEIRLVNAINNYEILDRRDENMKPYHKMYILKPIKNDKSSTLLFDIREQKVL